MYLKQKKGALFDIFVKTIKKSNFLLNTDGSPRINHNQSKEKKIVKLNFFDKKRSILLYSEKVFNVEDVIFRKFFDKLIT